MEPRELIARAAFAVSFPTDNPDVMYPRGPAWFHFGDKYADAIIAALDAAGIVPVPKVATDSMLTAGDRYYWHCGGLSEHMPMEGEHWDSILAASPYAKKEAG